MIERLLIHPPKPMGDFSPELHVLHDSSDSSDQRTIDFYSCNDRLYDGESDAIAAPAKLHRKTRDEIDRAGLTDRTVTIETLRFKARSQMAAWLAMQDTRVGLVWVTQENILISTTPPGEYVRPISGKSEGWHRDTTYDGEKLCLGIANYSSLPHARKHHFGLPTEYALQKKGDQSACEGAVGKKLAEAISAGITSRSIRLWPAQREMAAVNGKFIITPASFIHRVRRNTTDQTIKRVHYRMWTKYSDY